MNAPGLRQTPRDWFVADSPLEESGFEPSVPLLRKFLPGCCRREIPERLAGVPHHSGPFEAHCVCKDCRRQVEPDPAEMADPVQTPPDDSQLDAVYSMMQKTAA